MRGTAKCTAIVRARRTVETIIEAASAPIVEAEGLMAALLKFQPAFLGDNEDKEKSVDVLGLVRDAVSW